MNKRIVNLLRMLVLIEFLLGLILFLKEIIKYTHLPTIQEIEDQFGGIVNWFQYKESCYKYLFLYLLITVTGFSFWLSKKLYWGLTQILFITFFFVVALNLWTLNLCHFGINICLESLLLFIFLSLEMKICNHLLLKTMGIVKTVKYLWFVGGGLSCIIWFMLCN